VGDTGEAGDMGDVFGICTISVQAPVRNDLDQAWHDAALFWLFCITTNSNPKGI